MNDADVRVSRFGGRSLRHQSRPRARIEIKYVTIDEVARSIVTTCQYHAILVHTQSGAIARAWSATDCWHSAPFGLGDVKFVQIRFVRTIVSAPEKKTACLGEDKETR